MESLVAVSVVIRVAPRGSRVVSSPGWVSLHVVVNTNQG